MRVDVYNSTDTACNIRVTTTTGQTFEGMVEEAGGNNSFTCNTGDALVARVDATYAQGGTVSFRAPEPAGSRYEYYGVINNLAATSVCALIF